jgi:hypothetical protein
MIMVGEEFVRDYQKYMYLMIVDLLNSFCAIKLDFFDLG